jgi:plasmid stabilization system protein ParE
VLHSIHRTFDLIAAKPGCGVVYPTRSLALVDVRMIPADGYPNYLIFYRSTAKAVRVLYVLHGARHIPRLFRRDPRT